MIRLYRALLYLYPASFRGRYGDDLCAVVAQRLRDTAGPATRLGVLVAAMADVVRNASGAHAEILWQDLRYTVRTLRRSPGFVVTAVLIVALGVGANTAVFSVADFVLVRPLPFPEPDRLVRLWERTPGYAEMELSPPNYRDWKTMNGSLSAMGAYYDNEVNLVASGEPERVEGARITLDLFRVLGVGPLRGRAFASADGGVSDKHAVIVSYGLWQTELGGDPAVLGRTVHLDDVPYRVIGVMPESFHFPSREVRLWLPLIVQEADLDRKDNYFEAVGRLAPGVTLTQAREDLSGVAARLEQAYPKENEKTGATLKLLKDDVPQRARLLLFGLDGAALCILLLACANLTNLLLVRASARDREVAVRAALGAGRERLVRQVATESVVLAVVGGVVGVGLAAWAVPFLARLVPTSLPIAEQPRLDLRVLALAGAFTAFTGMGFGVLPALRSGRASAAALREAGRGGGGRRQRMSSVLVGIQVASSVVLLVSAGLLTRAMWRLQSVDPGFRTEGLLTLRTSLPMPRYALTQPRHEFYTHVLDGVRALPGVSGAAYTSWLPMAWGGGIWPVVIDGSENVRSADNVASLRFVTPDFFDVMGIPLLKGRGVSDDDTQGRTLVAVVSASVARRFWPDEDPIGKQFGFGLARRRVVGVVGDIRVRGLERESEPQVYLPARQAADSMLVYYAPKDLVIRSTLPPAQLLPAVRKIIHQVDPQQPISNVRTMKEVVAGQASSREAQLLVLGTLAAVALLLAGVGIHGLLAYTVSMRSREIGVRLALGADPGIVARGVLVDGLVLSAMGTVPGVLAALAAGQRCARSCWASGLTIPSPSPWPWRWCWRPRPWGLWCRRCGRYESVRSGPWPRSDPDRAERPERPSAIPRTRPSILRLPTTKKAPRPVLVEEP